MIKVKSQNQNYPFLSERNQLEKGKLLDRWKAPLNFAAVALCAESTMFEPKSCGNFISKSLVQKYNLNTIELPTPISLVAIDDKPVSSGFIAHRTQNLNVYVNNVHSEQLSFNIIDSPNHSIVLGAPWLEKHDPSISWSKKQVSFDSKQCTEYCKSIPKPVSMVNQKRINTETGLDDEDKK